MVPGLDDEPLTVDVGVAHRASVAVPVKHVNHVDHINHLRVMLSIAFKHASAVNHELFLRV